MRFTLPIRRTHVRIEIIPLIDIMFFLLASFMLVSLNMTKIENTPVNLPGATQVQAEFPPDLIHIAVDRTGRIYVEKKEITMPDLLTLLVERFKVNPRLPVYIGGDAATRHGDMVAILEFVRKAGIQNVSFTVSEGRSG